MNLDVKQQLHDEIDELKGDISDFKDVVKDKTDKKETQSIKAQFSRFAEYGDLKKLHAIVIPEIAKFEVKLEEVNIEVAQYAEIIRNFDTVI